MRRTKQRISSTDGRFPFDLACLASITLACAHSWEKFELVKHPLFEKPQWLKEPTHTHEAADGIQPLVSLFDSSIREVQILDRRGERTAL